MAKTAEERLRSRIVVTASGCWEIQGSRSAKGYGRIFLNGKARRTHRVSWETWRGEIPPGMLVCHRCDNPPCVNPDHLFLGSIADNNFDKESKGRAVHPRKLSADDVIEIRKRYAPGLGPALAAEFGVTRQHVVRVAKGHHG